MPTPSPPETRASRSRSQSPPFGAGRPVALVTGASAGIGRSFALALGARGMHVVLVARDEARLKEVAGEVEAAGGRAEVLAADLGVRASLKEVGDRVRSAAPALDLLVNNAGIGTMGRFADLPIEGEMREIALNVLAVVRLTHAALTPMIARGSGGIINVSSVAGCQPVPTNATYAATKAYVTSFTEAVHEETRGTGVKVMALCPGFTRTEFQARSGQTADHVPGFLWQQADEVVSSALRAFDHGAAVHVPGLWNRATATASSALPHGLTRRVAHLVTRRT